MRCSEFPVKSMSEAFLQYKVHSLSLSAIWHLITRAVYSGRPLARRTLYRDAYGAFVLFLTLAIIFLFKRIDYVLFLIIPFIAGSVFVEYITYKKSFGAYARLEEGMHWARGDVIEIDEAAQTVRLRAPDATLHLADGDFVKVAALLKSS